MKYISLLVFVLIGCGSNSSSTPEETNESNYTPSKYSSDPNQPYPDNESPAFHECEVVNKVEVRLDGGVFIFNTPVPCDPFWYMKDQGYPVPYKFKDSK